MRAVCDRGITKLNRVVQGQGHSELKFTELQAKVLHEMLELLLPFAHATDKLQGDKVCILYIIYYLNL